MSSPNSSQGAALEAGPLPRKRGEIGYTDELHSTSEEEHNESTSDVVLPARHPADHIPDRSSTILPPPSARLLPQRLSTNSSAPPAIVPVPSSVEIMPAETQKGLLRLWKCRRIIRGGFQLNTFILFTLQLITVLLTLSGWALSVHFLRKGTGGESGSIFLHIVFAVLTLGQLLFLERRLFRLRAERYMHIHPGEMLPSARFQRRLGSDPSFAFSPWNRPPLPTYAAALAESGVGTGDVEDHLIAAPPPPAYGNTRGSTMLLQGYLRNSLRAQRPNSQESSWSPISRPVSYRSRDEQWEAVEDAERARRLEETLATLERT